MNLRPLAQAPETKRPVMGVQASGVNPGEEISGSIEEMAAADVAIIRSIQPQGPYSLWGYSFGARVAYEVAAQLEEAGETVQELVFLAPGSPELESGQPVRGDSNTLFRDRSFLTILYSVFAHSIDPPLVEACVRTAKDEASFIEHVATSYPALDRGLIERIVRLVTATYGPTYGPEPRERPLKTPATILRAQGDSRSFVEAASVSLSSTVRILDLEPDHYTVLKPAGLPHVIAALTTIAAAGSEPGEVPVRISA
ncbi:thioesterase domain-containing protein (plasmid) [Microvirga sp. RSM25]|uniref:thioesterase domain-containing protein n=1 Tax=Microvirga sp. RSM25 TaxID=3273802 RepID=UPI00384F135E